MSKTVRDLMTPNPIALPPEATVTEAAKQMRDAAVGSLLVQRNGSLCGILTDRDIAMRVVAQDRSPSRTPLADVCSPNLATLSPDDRIGHAVALMRKKGIRRIPVTQDGAVVGVLSLGDLARGLDPQSALAGISAAPSNS